MNTESAIPVKEEGPSFFAWAGKQIISASLWEIGLILASLLLIWIARRVVIWLHPKANIKSCREVFDSILLRLFEKIAGGIDSFDHDKPILMARDEKLFPRINYCRKGP